MVIQHVEDLAVLDGWDLANGDELLLVDRFDNNNYFFPDLHRSGIEGLAQEDDQDNDDENGNTDEIQEYADPNTEDPNDPPGISLETAAVRDKISGVPPPQNPVELPVVDPLENKVYDGIIPHGWL